MKHTIFLKITICFFIIGLCSSKLVAQGAQKIGGNPFTLNPSAIFEIESSTRGFLPPRMTKLQLYSITPTPGLIVYCSDCSTTTGSELMISNGISWTTLLGANLANGKVFVGNGFGLAQERATTGTANVVLSDSPIFSGTPFLPIGTTAVTQSALDRTTALATTEFVTSAIEVATIPDATTARKGKLQLAGDLTGTADLPIIANDKIVTSKILNSNVTYAKIQDVTTGTILGRTSTGNGVVEEVATTGTGSVVLSDSPTFTGAPVLPTATTAVTQSALDRTTALATTEFVTSAIEVATIPDATTARKGKLQLAGDLTGTADLPIIANDKIVTSKILNSNVTYAKIQDVTTGTILGRTSTGNGVVEEVATTGTGSVVLSDSPTFTGAPVLPTATTAVTQTAGDNTTALATTAFVTNANATNANLTGDVTSIGNATTLSASGVTPGTYGNNLAIPVITVDGKGRITTLTTNLLSPSLQEESVEYTNITDGQTVFSLSHTPSNSTLVRMYINGVLISQSANTKSGTTVTYIPSNNGSYNLLSGDRIQFYYYF
jgi:hypothetical protein